MSMTMEMFEDTIREMVEEQVGDEFHIRIRKVRIPVAIPAP